MMALELLPVNTELKYPATVTNYPYGSNHQLNLTDSVAETIDSQMF